MGLLAVIGGSGFAQLAALRDVRTFAPDTPYGPTSAPILGGTLGDRPLLFRPRHGEGHRLPPHRINYRANIWALHAQGADRVLGLAAVGGITGGFGPRTFAVPDQIVDYTYGREHTFSDGESAPVLHIDFTEPYCPRLRDSLLHACVRAAVPVANRATYGATQGPRLESGAEIVRLERDGCDLVGMTGMPEAALARELGLSYASLAFVVNWAGGKGDGAISMQEIGEHLAYCAGRVERILAMLAIED
jgi:5'-methylthioinosine phosphorylase